MLEIILGVVVVLSLLALIFIIYNNKFQLAIIKIDKAEEDIEMYLKKKEELLNRTKPIIQKEVKLTIMNDLDHISIDANNFELHDILKKNYNELFKTLDENEKLLKSKALNKILEELTENEEDIVGAIKFYNDTVVDMNQLVSSFPSNIVAFLKRYDKKEFYNNEKREIFEILNDK